MLMCGVPSRGYAGFPLTLRALLKQAHGHPVEVLYLVDNKKRTVGEKRNALLQIANGDYVSFVDDDDEISHDYVDSLLASIETTGADVIVFPVKVTLNGEKEGIVRPSVRVTENEQYKPGGVTLRRPIQIACWRRAVVKDVKFPDRMFGEDHLWGDAAAKLVRSETLLEKVLYHYKWNERVSEAPPT